MKFSIIIPVYNTKPIYLKECVDSVLAQTYPDLEVIIVNDGSTNADTLKKLEEYKSFEKVKIIHSTNNGLGAARNLGIKKATGDYYVCIDSDDYYLSSEIISDMVELLRESQADLLSFQYAEFFDEKQRPIFCDGDLPRGKVYGRSATEAAKALLKAPRRVFSAVSHTKAINAQFVKTNGIIFPEGILCEDICFTSKILHYAKSYDRYNKVAHAFRRSNLYSLTASKKKFRDIEKDIIKSFEMLLGDTDLRNDRLVLDFLASSYVYWMSKTVAAMLACETKEEREEIKADIDQMRQYTYVLKYSSRIYIWAIGIVTNIFGIKFAMLILRVYLRLRRKHYLALNRKASD